MITGAVKSTPIEAMLLLANNRPVDTIIEERASLQFEETHTKRKLLLDRLSTKSKNLKVKSKNATSIYSKGPIFKGKFRTLRCGSEKFKISQKSHIFICDFFML